MKVPTEKLEKRIAKWNESNSFKKALETPFYQCSSGMKQILKCFIMTLHKPQVLIWDEPFRNLDDKTCDFLISQFWKDPDMTIIWTDHRDVFNKYCNCEPILLKDHNAL
jgi:ABC-type multidrug transport system ATPase subunit